MAFNTKISMDPANADVDGIADALPITTADPNGIAAALPTDTSWTVAGDAEYITVTVNSGKSQHIIVTTGADETTPQSTMTLVGTDRNGEGITERLTLPSTSTVVTTQQFLTVDGISVDVATTGVTDVGWLITSWNTDETALWVGTEAGDGLAHRLGVTTTGNEPAGADPLLTLTGTDADGKAMTETVTLPNATLIETTKYFLTVTEGSTGANAVAAVFDIGWVDEIASKTIPLNHFSTIGATAALFKTGTIGFDVELTYDLVNDKDFTWTNQASPSWINSTNIAAKSADIIAALDQGAQAARVVVNSYTDTAELKIWITQTESR